LLADVNPQKLKNLRVRLVLWAERRIGHINDSLRRFALSSTESREGESWQLRLSYQMNQVSGEQDTRTGGYLLSVKLRNVA